MYRFGPFTMDPHRRRLLHDGDPVTVPPKAFDILEALIENHGRTVEKDDLIRRVWPDTFVDEANLTQNIFMLRKVLEERASGLQYIATIPRRGYRFVAEVSEIVALPTESDSVTSLAVLPFTLLGMRREEDYLGLGMADALITCLSNVRQVVVRPTSAIHEYTKSPRDLCALGRRLQVDAIVEGTIQRADDRVRVTVQLVDVRAGALTWAERLEEPFTDLFAVQDAIALRVAASLVPRLNGEEKRRVAVRRTDNVQAYHAYLKGRYFWAKRSGDGLDRAIGAFRQAIDLDPAYALAYAGLADCYVILRSFGWVPAIDAARTAKAAASRALEIDEALAEAHTTLGVIRMTPEWDWQGAEAAFLRAIELAPNYAVARNWYANYLAATGRLDEAVACAQLAADLDPLSVVWRMGVGHMLFLARRYEEAVEQERQTLLVEPDFSMAHWVRGMACEQLGHVERAVDEMRKADALSGGSLLMRGFLARALALAGCTDEARDLLDELMNPATPRAAPPDAVGLIHAALGETDAAFEWLTRAAVEGSFFLCFLNVSPVFDSLRSDPRFHGLQQRIGLASTAGPAASPNTATIDS